MPPKRRAATRSTTHSTSPTTNDNDSAPSSPTTTKSSTADTSPPPPTTRRSAKAQQNSIQAAPATTSDDQPRRQIHPIYLLFFLTLEPLASMIGFYFAFFAPAYYLRETRGPMMMSSSSPAGSSGQASPKSTLLGLLGNNAGAMDAAVTGDAPWSHGAAAFSARGGLWGSNQDVPTSVVVALRQLANLYALFAFLEALVLRAASNPSALLSVLTSPRGKGSPARAAQSRSSASLASRISWFVTSALGLDTDVRYDVRVWKVFLAGLLVADMGHLWSLKTLGVGVYWRVWEWNGMGWGNLAFVYGGAMMRVAFLSGLGVGV